ncbi:GEVED domain-containing protein [Chloroflexota bacterium]
MKARLLLATAIALILLSLPALVLAQPPITLSTEPSGEGVEGAPLGSPDTLWDQPSDGYLALASQYFPSYCACGFYTADDFSNASPWNIESIFVDGEPEGGYTDSLLNANSLNWFIYPDAAGVPAGYPGTGGEAWSYSCLPTAPEVTISGPNNCQVTLDILMAQGSALYLPPGTYWLCFYPDLDFFSYGQWYWDTAGTTNLNVAHAIDPTGIIMPWYSWTPWSDLDPSIYDFAFRLEGFEGEPFDYGDAPEGALAYPATGVTGAFPTCKNVPIAGWIQHNNFGTWFGPAFDFESDGNHGLCPGFAPYDNDECFQDGDAGLILPQAYTIRGGIVVPCGISSYQPCEPCEYEICLEDSYGDGWNGGTVDVYVNGNPVYTGLTLASGSGPECHPIPVGNGDEITVDWTGGNWTYENEYYIYDSDGFLVRSEGTGGVDPGDVLPGELYAHYYACNYEICLADDYGDGWNGGTVDVFVNGNPVYTGLTLASGYGPECHPISVGNGDEITVYWTGFSFPYENAYYIYDSHGFLVRSEGVGGVDPGDVLPGELYAAGCPECVPLGGTPLGNPCGWAQWGPDIDILIHNWMPNHEPYVEGYVNVLIDWNQDGQWQNDPATTCDGSMVPEHVLVDFVIPPQYDGTLSALGPPDFQIGPNDGYVWVRFSITEATVGSNWTGEGDFEDGETEDYLLRVYQPPPVGGEAYPVSKASLLAPWIAVGLVLAGGISWYVLRRRRAQS